MQKDPLQSSIDRLRGLGLVPAMGQALAETADSALPALHAAVLADVSEFAATRNPDVGPELEAQLRELFASMVSLLSGRPTDSGFAEAYARRCAEQRFPLDAVLRSLNSVARAAADRLRDVAIRVADEDAELRQVVAASAGFALAHAGWISGATTESYVAATRALSEAAADRRSELFNLLLDGFDESDRRAASLLRSSGYLEQRQTYAVVAVRAANPVEMADAKRVGRIQDTLKEVLHNVPARVLTGIRDDLVIAIVSATARLSGWTRPHTVVSEIVFDPLRLMGNAVFVGVSTDAPSTGHIPRALSEAEQALRHASRAERVVRFDGIGFVDLVIEQLKRNVRTNDPEWLAGFRQKDRRGQFAKTLSAYADCDMNVLKTAEALGMHPNSVYARFDRIRTLTGLDPRRYHALTELLLALRLAES